MKYIDVVVLEKIVESCECCDPEQVKQARRAITREKRILRRRQKRFRETARKYGWLPLN